MHDKPTHQLTHVWSFLSPSDPQALQNPLCHLTKKSLPIRSVNRFPLSFRQLFVTLPFHSTSQLQDTAQCTLCILHCHLSGAGGSPGQTCSALAGNLRKILDPVFFSPTLEVFLFFVRGTGPFLLFFLLLSPPEGPCQSIFHNICRKKLCYTNLMFDNFIQERTNRALELDTIRASAAPRRQFEQIQRSLL